MRMWLLQPRSSVPAATPKDVNIRSARLIFATPAAGMQLRVHAIAPGSIASTLSVVKQEATAAVR